MSTLFACTRCHSRHAAEDLSEGLQLCKECLSKKEKSANNGGIVSLTMNKCSYCRDDFPQQDEKNSMTVCRKCNRELKAYGEPKTCGYCNLKAAFNGSRCYRCQHSEKKYGPPVPCNQCKQKCAFDKYKDPAKAHKLMCWLCILSYKRVMERTGEYHKRKAQQEESLKTKHKHHKHEHHHHHHDHNPHSHEKHEHKHSHRSGSASGSNNGTPATSRIEEGKSREQRLAELTTGSGMESKRLKLDTAPSPSNGTQTPSRMMSDIDPSSTDHVIALQQLKDQVDSLKKQLKEKDQQLMEKEKQLTILKASMYENEKDLRNKLQTLQKRSDTDKEEITSKNRHLQKQVATLTKLNKNTKSVRQSTPTTSP